MDQVDPVTVAPTPGRLLVEIVEVLGGTQKSGLFIPPATQTHMGKDTFYGKILQVGDPPRLKHHRHQGSRGGFEVKPVQATWSSEVMAQFREGDIMIFPRDVPLAFHWDERRFAFVEMHEGMFALSPEDFDAQDFQVVPWQPGE